MRREAFSAVFVLSLLVGAVSAPFADSVSSSDTGKTSSPLSFHLTPGFSVPLGESAGLFTVGGGAVLSGEYHPAAVPFLAIRGGLEFDYAPLASGPFVSIVSAALGPKVQLGATPWLQLEGYVAGGYFYGFLGGAAAPGGQGGAVLDAGAGVSFFIFPAVSLGLKASYKNYFGLYQGISASVGTSFYPGKAVRREKADASALPDYVQTEGKALKVEGIEFENIFPVFYKHYDDHPIGRATLRNLGESVVSDISLSVRVRNFMDAPKECSVPEALQGQEGKAFDLYALFNESILEVTEGTKVAVEMTMKYKVGGTWYTQDQVESMRVEFRNAMTWDDDKKAAAFITARDPAIMSFSKNVSSFVKGKASSAINANLCLGIAIHEALRLYGLSYQVDPRTPYSDFHEKRGEPDFLQFPRETLGYRSGDCDDLAILYAALLESLGVPTAFITVPGHVYIAFGLDMDRREAETSFLKPEELVYVEDNAWLPLEATDRGSFLSAWQRGAKKWREYLPADQAKIYTTAESWSHYEPVALPGAPAQVRIPEEQAVVDAYLQEVNRFVEREIYPQVEELQKGIEESGGKASMVNRLGVLYARYGLLEKARAEFEKVLEQQADYVPALVNQGSLFFQQNDMDRALEYYERAYRIAPESAKVLLCCARVNHELENYGTVKKVYGELKEMDPELAQKFAYLEVRGEEAKRAADTANVTEVMVWMVD